MNCTVMSDCNVNVCNYRPNDSEEEEQAYLLMITVLMIQFLPHMTDKAEENRLLKEFKEGKPPLVEQIIVQLTRIIF